MILARKGIVIPKDHYCYHSPTITNNKGDTVAMIL